MGCNQRLIWWGGTNVRQPAMRQSAAAMRQCGNAAMRQCGNAAMILKKKFINKNFHKKQIFVTNNPKILQISLRLFDEKYLQKYKTLSTINSSTVAPLEANHISGIIKKRVLK